MINNINHTIQEFALNDSIHLILFFTLLSSFYFYYVTQEEEDAQLHLVKQLLRLDPENKNNTLINDIISKIVTNYPHILDGLKENSNISEKRREEQNLIFKKRTYYSILILLVFLTLINFIIKIYYKEEYIVSFTGTLFSNIISVLILGVVEYIFFILIVKKYKRMDENTLLYKILKEYQDGNKSKK